MRRILRLMKQKMARARRQFKKIKQSELPINLSTVAQPSKEVNTISNKETKPSSSKKRRR